MGGCVPAVCGWGRFIHGALWPTLSCSPCCELLVVIINREYVICNVSAVLYSVLCHNGLPEPLRVDFSRPPCTYTSPPPPPAVTDKEGGAPGRSLRKNSLCRWAPWSSPAFPPDISAQASWAPAPESAFPYLEQRLSLHEGACPGALRTGPRCPGPVEQPSIGFWPPCQALELRDRPSRRTGDASALAEPGL